MAWRRYNINEIASYLDVTEEYFHREVKKLIKCDFKVELKEKGITNPDILLNEDGKMRLVDPDDGSNFIDTDLDIHSYI